MLLGLCTILLLTGMSRIDTALYEAARIDGAREVGLMRQEDLEVGHSARAEVDRRPDLEALLGVRVDRREAGDERVVLLVRLGIACGVGQRLAFVFLFHVDGQTLDLITVAQGQSLQ